MKKTIARFVVLVLVFTMFQPFFYQEKVHAAPDAIILAEADKFIDAMGSYPDGVEDTDGQLNTMFVGYFREPGTDFGAENAALRFNLQGINPNRVIASAELKIYVKRVDRIGGNPFIDLWGSNYDDWLDAPDLSMPSEHESIVANHTNLTAGQWLAFNVKSFIIDQKSRAENQKASFLLKGHQNPPSMEADISSQIGYYGIPATQAHPNAQYTPRLEITYVPNSPPTNITLSGTQVSENSPADTLVGTLSATDPDLPSETHTYSLVGGDQSAFTIVGNELRTAQAFDYEAKSSYKIKIKAMDSAGQPVEKEFDIAVTNVNEPLTAASVTINGGAAYTNSPNVTLQSTITDPDNGLPLEMQFSNVHDSWPNDWKSYTATPTETQWTLAGGDGEKTVYMQARDGSGQTITVEDTITLDTTPPAITGVTDNGVYTDDVTVSFNEGTGVLNGTPFSGGTVSEERLHTLVVTDAAGNTSTVTFRIDKTPPTGSLAIQNGNPFTTAKDVTLNITGTDGAGSGNVQMSFSDDDTSWTPWEPMAPTKAWQLSEGDGEKTVKMKLKDAVGHVKDYEDSITLDTKNPVGTLQILGTDDANTATSKTDVSLNLTASDENGPVQVSISNTAGDFSGGWQNVQGTHSWTLTAGDGEKTVYAKFRDAAGNESTASDTILLDTTPPAVSGVTNNGKYSTNVTPTFTEGTATLNGSPFASGTAISMDGTYELIVTDAVNNSTTVKFTIDKTAPTGQLKINNGALYTNSANVTLEVTATDATQMTAAYANESSAWSPPEPYQSTKPWTLSAGEGTKTVRVKLVDELGNEAIITAEIVLDEQAPTGGFTINNGKSHTNSRTVSLALTFADDNNQVEMRVTNNDSNNTWTDWEPAKNASSWDLETGDGAKTVYVELRDQAGNVFSLSDGIILDTTAPVVTGVAHQATYNTDVTISFMEGTAKLNGADFTSGSTVSDEGLYTLVVTDEAENQTTIMFTLDKAAPTGTFVINQGAEYTSSNDVTLSMSVNGNEEGLQMSFSESGGPWTTPEPFQETKNWTLSGGDGDKTIGVRLRDKAGNITDYSDTIKLDTVKPTGSVTINNGAAVVNSRNVTLALTASDTSNMDVRLANEDNAWSSWGAFSAAKDWELTGGDGTKTVQMEIRDQAGNVTTVSDTITLDQNVPDVEGVEDGGIYNKDVEITFSEGTATLNGFPFASGTKVTADGSYTLVVTDDAGNTATILFKIDKTPPTGSFTINGGAATTRNVNVTLDVTADDVLGEVEMRISNENEPWSEWKSVTASVPWRLENGNGTKKVLLEIRDEAHNTISLEDTIELRVYSPPPPPAEIPVTGVTLDVNSLKLQVGEKKTLEASIQPADATNKRVRWASSNPRVAEVDADGQITALRQGETIVTVTTEDGGKTDSAEVTVYEKAAFHLEASEDSFWLKPKESTSFQIYKIDGKKRTDITRDKEVTYETENELVSIKSGRIIAGKKEGEDLITVSYQGVELAIPVTVSGKTLRSIEAATGSQAVLEEGEDRKLTLIATFSDESSEDITEDASWSSSDPDVAEVTDEGKLIAGEEGKAVITAKYAGKRETIRVLVVEEKEPRRISASPSYLRLNEGQSREIVLYAYYQKGYQDVITGDVEWSVEDPEIATVEDNTITGIKTGRTTVTVTYEGKTEEIAVIVR